MNRSFSRTAGLALVLAFAAAAVLASAKSAWAANGYSGITVVNNTGEPISISISLDGNTTPFTLQPKGQSYDAYRWTYRDGGSVFIGYETTPENYALTSFSAESSVEMRVNIERVNGQLVLHE